jgi:kynurenine formamidase
MRVSRLSRRKAASPFLDKTFTPLRHGSTWYLLCRFYLLQHLVVEILTTKLIDLSQEISNGLAVYRGHQPTAIFPVRKCEELPGGRWSFAVNTLLISEHCGTHTDSFVHMDPRPEALAVQDIPLSWCCGPAICLDLSAADPGAFITRDHLCAALAAHKLAVPAGGQVLIYTGHYGRNFSSPDYNLRHPGLDRGAMEYLAEAGVRNVGIDCPSVDIEPHQGAEWKPAHSVCRERTILNTENLGDLRPVAGKAFYYMGLPMRIRGGTAAPIRAVAIMAEGGGVPESLPQFA